MLFRSDVQAALSAGGRAVEGAEKLGSPMALVNAYHHHGMALGLNGEGEAARDQLQQALDIARANRVFLTMEGGILAALAEAHLGSGDAARARRILERFVDRFPRSEEAFHTRKRLQRIADAVPQTSAHPEQKQL